MASSYNAYLFTLLIPPAILSFVNAELGPDPTFTWITISWNLGGAIFVTVGGRLSDIFGRRWFFITGSGVLVIGAIVGATGQSVGQMIASGAIFGAGSGLLEMAFGAVQVSCNFSCITPQCRDVWTESIGNRAQRVANSHHRPLRRILNHCPNDAVDLLGHHQIHGKLAKHILCHDRLPNIQYCVSLDVLPPSQF